ncbi:MAG TPA: AraC family transcriptional regulator [Oceanobacillus sp.]|nr:AraC family transcriptional regulator [Oceanobacillus sp.]
MNPRERSKYWRAEGFDDLELLSATYFTHTFDRHIHEGYAIGVILQGAEKFYYRGAIRAAQQGQLVAINPGEIHTGEAVTHHGWMYRMIYPGITLMRQIAREMTGKDWQIPYFPNPVMDDPELAELFRRAHMVLEHSQSNLERETALRDVMGAFILRHAENRPRIHLYHNEQRAVRIARDYLETHYTENVTLETLAAHAGISPFHLVRLFRAQTGMPPHLYLTHIRIMRAKALLALGVPITQVALAVGFVDQSHLTRRFKRIVGVPPGHYLQSVS